MKISVVLILAFLGCALAQEDFAGRRNKRTAHFLLHQFADLLGYEIIPKVAVVADIRSRLGLSPLNTLAQQPQGQQGQIQPAQNQQPQTQPPPRTSTQGTTTTTAAKMPTTSAQAPPSSEGPVRLPLPLNILNRLQPTVPIINPPEPTAIPRVSPAGPVGPSPSQLGLQQTNLNFNLLYSKAPTSSAPTGDTSSSAASEETPTGPSAEAPSSEEGGNQRFQEDNYVFNPRDAANFDDDEFNPNLAFTGWRPPMPDEFNFEDSSEVKFNPAPSARSVPPPVTSSAPGRLDPVALAYPKSNYISAFVPNSLHRRRSAISQHRFSTKGSQYGYMTYHSSPFTVTEI
ncbi:hypothetical protein DMENIID0001_043910 [Sergentomyia squamirostris]